MSQLVTSDSRGQRIDPSTNQKENVGGHLKMVAILKKLAICYKVKVRFADALTTWPQQLLYFMENYHLAMSTIIFLDHQTMKIKKKILANIPRGW